MTGVVAVMAGLSEQTSPTLVIFDFSTPTSGVVTVPVGATDLVVEAWGGGGGGGLAVLGDYAGGGGGAGGYSKTTLALSGDDGKTIRYSVGAEGAGSGTPDPGDTGGTTTVFSGTYTLASLVAGGGGGGLSDGSETQGAGGAASGGTTTNTTGAGSAVATQLGAAATAGDGGLVGGAGGRGGTPTPGNTPGTSGLPGRVRFVFTI
jgi:hypothetical protein